MLILLYLISFTYHEIPGIFLNLLYKKNFMVQMTVSFFPPFSPFFINQVVILSRTTYTYLIFYQPTITREIKINTKKKFSDSSKPTCLPYSNNYFCIYIYPHQLCDFVPIMIETYRYANQSLDFYLDFTLYPYRTHTLPNKSSDAPQSYKKFINL